MDSSEEHKPEEHKPHGWFTETCAHWLTGLVLAALISVLAVHVGHSDLGPRTGLRWLERWGVDTTMRLYAPIYGGRPIGHEEDGETFADGRPKAPPGYVFIDLDAPTCLEASGRPNEPSNPCRHRSVASPGAAARVANALIGQGNDLRPRVIVLDVRLWDSNPDESVSNDVAQLLKTVAEGGAPPILAPSPTSPLSTEEIERQKAAPDSEKRDPREVFVDWSVAPACVRNSGIHFAPALLWPDAPDGIARRYPLMASVQVMKVAGGPGDRTGKPEEDCAPPAVDADALGAAVPSSGEAATLPYLAALYAALPPASKAPDAHAALDCASVGASWRGGVHSCGSLDAARKVRDAGHHGPASKGGSAVEANNKGEPPEKASLDEQWPRTFFTIGEHGNAKLEAANRYGAYAASQILTAGGALALPREQIADRIVVVGYSGALGMDRHATPIGEMPGAHVIINAIRSFATGTTLKKSESWWEPIKRELDVTLVSSVPFFFFWLIAVPVSRAANGARLRVWWVPAAGFIALLFVGTVLISASLALWWVAHRHAHEIAEGVPVDALLPLLVLVLESFAHLAKYFIAFFHHAAIEVVGLAGGWIARFIRPVGRWFKAGVARFSRESPR